MSVANPAGDLRSEKMTGKTYIGVVVDNNDPLKLQRVRARVRDVHRDVDDAGIPWAMQATESPQGNAAGIGSVAVPVIGAKVLIEFMDDTLYHPKYYASPMTSDVVIQELVGEDYPHVLASIDAAGNLFKNNTAKSTIDFVHVSGTSIYIAADGSIKIDVAQGYTLNVLGNCAMKVQGDTTIETSGKTDIMSKGNTTFHSTGRINFAGSKINLNSGPSGSVGSPSSVSPRTRPEITPLKDAKDY